MSEDQELYPFYLYQAAWIAASECTTFEGNLEGDLDDRTKNFLKRKAVKPFPAEEAKQAFQTAVEISQEKEKYRRKHFGTTLRSTVRRYEILLELAQHLTKTFPDAPDYFVFGACRALEWRWDR